MNHHQQVQLIGNENNFLVILSNTLGIATAASLGSIGGVVLLIAAYVGYKFRQRRKRRNEVASNVTFSNNRRGSTGSGSSNSSGTVIVATDATYNTVNNDQ